MLNNQDLLSKLIEYQSTSWNELEIIEYLSWVFANLWVKVKKTIKEKDWEKIYNIIINPSNEAKIILNSHVDVVPAPNREDAYKPMIEWDKMFWRWACDAKWQVVTIYDTYKKLLEKDKGLCELVQAHIVCWEEVWGYWSLHACKNSTVQPDLNIILEPTKFLIHPANRWAVRFKISVTWTAMHMWEWDVSFNAINKVSRIIVSLDEFKDQLISSTKAGAMFNRKEEYIKVNVWKIKWWEFPSMVADNVCIYWWIAFLPPYWVEEIIELLDNYLQSKFKEFYKDIKIEIYQLRNEPYDYNIETLMVDYLEDSCKSLNIVSSIEWRNASCDARIYAHHYKVPTIVFGPWDLKVAHSDIEHININDIDKASTILSKSILQYLSKIND